MSKSQPRPGTSHERRPRPPGRTARRAGTELRPAVPRQTDARPARGRRAGPEGRRRAVGQARGHRPAAASPAAARPGRGGRARAGRTRQGHPGRAPGAAVRSRRRPSWTAWPRRPGVSTLELAVDLVNQARATRSPTWRRLPRRGHPAGHRLRGPAPSAQRRGRRARRGDAQAVAQSILQHALEPLGAVAVAIWAAHADQSLTLAGSAGFADEEPARWRHVPPGVPTPARAGRSSNRAATDYAALAEAALPSIGLRNPDGGRIAVPAGAGGRIIGVLEICWAGPLTPAVAVHRTSDAGAGRAVRASPWRAMPVPDSDLAAAVRRPARVAELLDLADGLHDPCLVLEPLLDVGGHPRRLPDPARQSELRRLRGPAAQRDRRSPAAGRVPARRRGGRALREVEHVLATGEPFRAENMRLAAVVDAVAADHAGPGQHQPAGHPRPLVVAPRGRRPRVANLLQHAQRLGRIGGFEENLLSGEIAWNESLFELHGLPPDLRAGPARAARRPRHPDDAAHHRPVPADAAAPPPARVRRLPAPARRQRGPAHPRGRRTRTRRRTAASSRSAAPTRTSPPSTGPRSPSRPPATSSPRAEQETAERNRLALQLQHAIMPPSHGPAGPARPERGRALPARREGPPRRRRLVRRRGAALRPRPAVRGRRRRARHRGGHRHGRPAQRPAGPRRHRRRTRPAPGLAQHRHPPPHRQRRPPRRSAVCTIPPRASCAGPAPAICRPSWCATARRARCPSSAGSCSAPPARRGTRRARIQLEIGDTLMMYTDGLIERRDRSVQDSLDNLLASGPGRPPVGPGQPAGAPARPSADGTPTPTPTTTRASSGSRCASGRPDSAARAPPRAGQEAAPRIREGERMAGPRGRARPGDAWPREGLRHACPHRAGPCV